MTKGANKTAFGVFNARSICNKTTAVLELLMQQNIDICFVTETWMKRNDTVKMAEIHERGFEMFNDPRKGSGGGAGFIFNLKTVHLIKNDVKKYSSFQVLESILQTSTETLRLCVIYRSTQHTSRKKYLATRQAKFFEEFSDYLECLASKPGKPLICGDFNFHVENYLDSVASQFMNLIKDRGFKQHIVVPTHFSGGTLDLVLTKSCPKDFIDVTNVSVTPNTGTTSDHFFVSFNIPLDLVPCRKKSSVPKKVRELAKINIEAFKVDIKEKMPEPTSMQDLTEAVEKYNSVLKEVLESHAPLTEIQINEQESPWLNAACKKARRERRKAEKLYKKNRSDKELLQNFKEKQVDAALTIDLHRNKYYTSKLSAAEGDSKATYKIINTLFDKEHGSKKLPNGSSDKGLAEQFKGFFHEKVSNIYKEIESSQGSISTISPKENYDSLDDNASHPSASYFKLLIPSQVEEIIKSMASKSCLLDPVPTWLFKSCMSELLPMVTLIVNLSLQSGCFPDQLKTAVVRPLLKKHTLDSDVFSNYRPVSNLSFLSKIIEKCVHIQLTEYLDRYKLFPELQSGYRRFHSCETAILRIHNDLLYAMDKQTHACLMLIDLSAAFDTINHQLLLKRLEKTYHIKDIVKKWIMSYLTNRTFQVSINDCISSEAKLEIGVPQGSILGPLLFILYTVGLQSLAKKYNFSIHLYADDTQIYFEFDPKMSNSSIMNDLEQCFIDIKDWMSLNYLKMNDSKTKIMEIHSPYTSVAPRDNFKLDSCVIDPTDKAKNLGFWFDNHLSLDKQISKTSQTCYQNMRKIGRIGSKLSKDLKIQLVHSFIHSVIDNCNGAYFAISASQLQKLQKIQNSAVRYIFNLKGKERYQSITPYLKELHFLPVIYRIRFKLSLMVFKCINNIAPSYLSDLVTLRQPNQHSVRADDDYFLLKESNEPRCKKTQGAFSYSAPKTWNVLPYNLRSMSEIEAFKVALKTHLYKCAFLDLNNENFIADIELL